MYHRIVNWIIFICSAIILGFIFFNILKDDKNVYRFYTYTINGELFIISYYFLYLLGSFLNLKKNNQGNKILFFAFLGFILSAIVDFIFVETYSLLFYLCYILLNSIVIIVVKRNIIWNTFLVFVGINTILIVCLFLIFNTRLIL